MSLGAQSPFSSQDWMVMLIKLELDHKCTVTAGIRLPVATGGSLPICDCTAGVCLF
jgi:hypothetical protein